MNSGPPIKLFKQVFVDLSQIITQVFVNFNSQGEIFTKKPPCFLYNLLDFRYFGQPALCVRMHKKQRFPDRQSRAKTSTLVSKSQIMRNIISIFFDFLLIIINILLYKSRQMCYHCYEKR